MRKTIVINLLLAGLALAGCQKGVNYGGRPVTFTASSADPYTRTAYSNVITNGFERIDWAPNDRILVWSDFAAMAYDSDDHSAEYIIDVITPDGRNSKATLKNASANGLVYVDGKDSYKFWATYPVASGNPTANSVTYTIPAAQTIANGAEATTEGDVTTIPADMSNAWLLAAAEGAQADTPVEMYFYPGFTAFELTDGTNEAESREKYPVIRNLPRVVSSDAHYLWDISEGGFTIPLDDEPYSTALVRNRLIDYLLGMTGPGKGEDNHG